MLLCFQILWYFSVIFRYVIHLHTTHLYVRLCGDLAPLKPCYRGVRSAVAAPIWTVLKSAGLIQRASQKVINKKRSPKWAIQLFNACSAYCIFHCISECHMLTELGASSFQPISLFFFPSGVCKSMIFHSWIRLSKMTFIWFAAARWHYDWFWE